MTASKFNTYSDLINELKQAEYIKSPNVETVMRAVDRKYFAPTDPYMNYPRPIGKHAHALEILKPKLVEPNCRILDVGCGSGYLTLCMSLMNRCQGKVIGIDHFENLVNLSARNIKTAGYGYLLESGIINLKVHDGRLGYETHSPYDVIYVGAACSKAPQPLLDQLAIGGMMLVPIGGEFGQVLTVYERCDQISYIERCEFRTNFVPLTDRNKQFNQITSFIL